MCMNHSAVRQFCLAGDGQKEGNYFMFKILVANFGATSTKISIFENEKMIDELVIRHSAEEMAAAPLNKDQVELRARLIEDLFKKQGMSIEDFDAVGMRAGGVTKAKKSGTYIVNEAMREDALSLFKPDGEFLHGARIVLPTLEKLLEGKNIPIYVTDPPHIDELADEARLTGHKEFKKTMRYHCLNQKAVAREVAAELGKKYEEVNLIIAHMGGGVSVVAHQNGRMVEAPDCAEGSGPMSPERSGTLPVGEVIDKCFSGEFTKAEMRAMMRGKGGVYSYLGTADMREAEEMSENDAYADLIVRTFAYQIAREIGACYAALCCKADAIVYTGGIAYSEKICGLISERVSGMAPIINKAGEKEADALALGALRVLRKEEEILIYQ